MIKIRPNIVREEKRLWQPHLCCLRLFAIKRCSNGSGTVTILTRIIMDRIVGGTKASLMAAFSSRLLFEAAINRARFIIGDATVASRRWLSFNWGQLINSRLDEPSV